MAASSVEGKIKPIDRAAVHRICSGQVVLDLATAVKELVENSLDAGATIIEIRLKDHGSELIEVSDNGHGVSPDNYQGLTLKYHTSKISNFTDLQSLSSFGFRGEALSSLCALANLSIITRTKNEPIAAHLKYHHSGVILSQENVARSVGTTVSVAKLFSPLPVRFKEFRRENNLRREYGRLLSVLQAYAVIAKGVRIICSHQGGKGGRNVVVQTQGNTSMRDNLLTVFGSKTASCMEALDLMISDNSSVEGFVSKPGVGCGRPSGDRQFFYVNGRPVDLPKVAKLLNELYRSFNSLQYPMAVLNFILPTTAYDVNVTPDKRKLFLHSESELLAALRGSLEKAYTPTKYTYTMNSLENGRLLARAMSLAEKKQGRASEDSNCAIEPETPGEAEDTEEGVANISDEPVKPARGVCSGKVPVSFLSFQRNVTNGSVEKRESTLFATAIANEKNLPTVQAKKNIQPTLVPCASRGKRPAEEAQNVLSEVPVLKRWRLLGTDTDEDEHEKIEEVHDVHDKERESPKLSDRNGLHQSPDFSNAGASEEDELDPAPSEETDVGAIPANKAKVTVRKMVPCSKARLDKKVPLGSSAGTKAEKGDVESKHRVAAAKQCRGPATCCAEPGAGNCNDINPVPGERVGASVNCATEVDDGRKEDQAVDLGEKPVTNISKAQYERVAALMNSKRKVGAATDVAQAEQTAEAPQQLLKLRYVLEITQKKDELGILHGLADCSIRKQMPRRKSAFAAATLNAVGKDDAEKEAVLKAATKELERSFNKADFKKMKILGQFNLGFILAKIDEDMFIIDQHASDEKYNFERLSKTTVLNRQPLLRPLALELSAAEEMTLLSHMETFRKNGFDFFDNDNAPAGHRLQLSAVPFSQNVTFGVGDVQELISLLADEPVITTPQKDSSWLPRPSRVRAMLASRACRSSIMIGDPLSKKQMERILSHLADLDAPWNCPHGRPTMRHLLDLNSIKK